MRIRKPSPAMVVAIIALVMASTGSAVAAVNFARNAGAVDGRSAVSADSSNSHAAGNLVATRSKGSNAGKIPIKFLAGVAYADTFANFFDVGDNATGAQVTVEPTVLGNLNASCSDQAAGAGVEDPTVTLSFANTSGRDLNYFRRVGADGATTVTTLANGTADTFTINGQNNFRVHVQDSGGASNVVIEGFTRQFNVRTPSGNCAVTGSVEEIT
jgi:hypothetical protein